MQRRRAGDGHRLDRGQADARPERSDVPRHDRIRFGGSAERRDADVGQDAVERLRDDECHEHRVAEARPSRSPEQSPGVPSRARARLRGRGAGRRGPRERASRGPGQSPGKTT